MPGRHYSESTLRFPFQDDDISEDELTRPLALMNFIPRGSRTGLGHSVQPSSVRTGNGWSDDDYDYDYYDDDHDSASESEVVSTHTGPHRQVSGPTQPMLVSRVTNAPLSRSDLHQRTTETLAEIATRLLETERILGRSVSIPVPISVPTGRPIHSFGQPQRFFEVSYPNQPANWATYHEYFLWSCRGSVPTITDHMQAIYRFSPPLQQSFVRAKLSNHNALRQFEFLQAYLPGEAHSMQRAEARVILWETGLNDPEVQDGRQRIEVPQFNPPDDRYEKPRLPRGQPPMNQWVHMHDSYLLLFLGNHPSFFLRKCRWMFDCQPTDHFISVRMAQLPFLGISGADIEHAIKNLKPFGLHTGLFEEGISF